MNYIVFDLEFTILQKKQYLADIVEVGAIKLSDRNNKLEVVDMYQSFVKPYGNAPLSELTTEFTGISQDDVDRAPSYPEMINDFRNWLGNEDYYLISWGPDDKFQFVRHSIRYKLPVTWIKNYNDLQEQISKKLIDGEKFQRIGLTKALESYNISFEGQQHRAIDDAFNTAKIFVEAFPELIFSRNNAEDDLKYTTKTVYKTGDEHFYPFAALSNILESS